jgi:glycosyltransferase involved in cell wall biosynthesis
VSTISVVIPSYNHPDNIRQCVDSLLGQSGAGNFEVVVVDSSPAEVQQRVEERLGGLDRVKLVRRKQQTFPGTARNIGVDQATGEIIAFIDADCIAEPDWLATIRSSIERGMMLAGVILNGTPQDRNGTSSYLVEFNEFLPFKQRRRFIAAAPTCNLAVYKDDFLRLGGFTDDRAFEDFLFCRKFTDSGGRIVQLNELRIHHMNKTVLSDIVRNQRLLGRHSALVRQRHGMPPQAVFRRPRLAYALVPYRFTKILSRARRAGQLWPFLRNARTIAYLLLQWTHGFYTGATTPHIQQLASSTHPS